MIMESGALERVLFISWDCKVRYIREYKEVRERVLVISEES